jgi:hypothetical protein
MKVFVKRSDLTLSANAAVSVIGYYDDHTDIAPTAHGAGATVLSLGPEAVVTGPLRGMTLASNWRDLYRDQMAHGEAERRIVAAFPEHSQRNCLAEYMGYIVAHGPDAAKWPKVAQSRRAEIERLWAYVTAVRLAARSVATALPTDPTADAHWPARISKSA